jgi:hypothetical protein
MPRYEVSTYRVSTPHKDILTIICPYIGDGK